jgi:hypothetical protein
MFIEQALETSCIVTYGIGEGASAAMVPGVLCEGHFHGLE